jgi:pSer/pThr/pTyr-binding forkhead associated (FHA) protein
MEVNLVLIKDNGSQKVLPLPSPVTVIGRRHECDLCIPLASVSRRHCQLGFKDGLVKIRDLNSRNGTLLNGKMIDDASAKRGDLIEVGPLKFVLQIDGEPSQVTLPELTSEKPAEQEKAGQAASATTENDQFANFEDIAKSLENEIDQLDGQIGSSDSDADTLLDEF